MWVQSLHQEDTLEEEMATHSSILAWEIPWTEESGNYSPWGPKHYSSVQQQQQQKIVVRALNTQSKNGILSLLFIVSCSKKKKKIVILKKNLVEITP